MQAKVAVFESHEKAFNAVKLLNEKKFPLRNVSIIGKAVIVKDNIHLKSNDVIVNAPLAIGTIAGAVTGILTGIGIFAVPGLGFLYGAGAFVGMMGGLDLGILGGGLGTILAFIGVKKDSVVKYEDHLHEGKYLLLVHGSMDDIVKAEHILHTEGTHLE